MIVSGAGVSITPSIEEIKVNIGQKGSSPIDPGQGREHYVATYHGKIKGWAITGYPSGDLVVDVLKAYQTLPNSWDTITGSDPPTLSNAELNSNLQITAWTDTDIKPGDVFGINILSVSGIEHAVVTIQIMQN
jgi:hypothetical protein